MSDDLDANSIQARVEQWRHFVSRRTVGDDVDAPRAGVDTPTIRPGTMRAHGYPAGPDGNGQRSAPKGPHFGVNDGRQAARVPAGARRAGGGSGARRSWRVRLQPVEVILWVLAGAIVVAVSFLVSRAMP